MQLPISKVTVFFYNNTLLAKKLKLTPKTSISVTEFRWCFLCTQHPRNKPNFILRLKTHTSVGKALSSQIQKIPTIKPMRENSLGNGPQNAVAPHYCGGLLVRRGNFFTTDLCCMKASQASRGVWGSGRWGGGAGWQAGQWI